MGNWALGIWDWALVMGNWELVIGKELDLAADYVDKTVQH